MKRKYKKEAALFIEAIKTIAQKEENIENLESYLSIHFDTWMRKFASTPKSITAELEAFASMEI
jgi:hypothetical protein